MGISVSLVTEVGHSHAENPPHSVSSCSVSVMHWGFALALSSSLLRWSALLPILPGMQSVLSIDTGQTRRAERRESFLSKRASPPLLAREIYHGGLNLILLEKKQVE